MYNRYQWRQTCSAVPHITLVYNKREIRVACVLFIRCSWDEIGCQYYEVQFCVCICQLYMMCGGLYWSLFFGLHVYLLVQVTRILVSFLLGKSPASVY